MKMQSTGDLFEYELQRAYHLELLLVNALDEMARNATRTTIGGAFADHRRETQDHVERVRRVFDAIGREPTEREHRVIVAVNDERKAVEEGIQNNDLLNLYYLASGLQIERIELSMYESLLTMGDRLNLPSRATTDLEANRNSERKRLRQLQTFEMAADLKAFWKRILP